MISKEVPNGLPNLAARARKHKANASTIGMDKRGV